MPPYQAYGLLKTYSIEDKEIASDLKEGTPQLENVKAALIAFFHYRLILLIESTTIRSLVYNSISPKSTIPFYEQAPLAK